MEILLPAYLIGLMASAVTELLKLFPLLNKNDITKVFTTVVVMAAGTLWHLGFDVSAWDWNLFGQVVIWSFVNYKMIVQPVATTTGLKTQ